MGDCGEFGNCMPEGIACQFPAQKLAKIKIADVFWTDFFLKFLIKGIFH